MPKTKVEVYDKDQLIYPFIESDHVTFSNGMKVSEMLDQSISMPTVTHENLSFKVGVGDQDVSSAIVDSSVAEMTIKGKTYQNILPEPSTHVLTNNKEMFKVNEGLDPNVEIVDGISKSAILSGNTLINMANQQEAEIIFNQRYQMYIVKNNVQPGGLIHGEHIYMSMEVNIHELNIETSLFRCLSFRGTGGYAFIVKSFDEIKNIPKNTWVRISTIRQVKEAESLDNYSLQFGLLGEHPTVSGEQIARVSFRNPIWINLTKIYGNGNEPTLTECDNIPYFEGMQSVKMPVLTTTGKNLFDKEAFYNDWKSKVESYVYKEIVDNEEVLKIHNLNLLFADNKGFKIFVEKDVPLTLTLKCKKAGTTNTTSVLEVRYGDSSLISVGVCQSDVWEERTITFTPTRDYITICSGYNVNDYFYIKDIQLEVGSVKTPYEPYKTNILSTPSDLELRGIDDVKDELNCLTGEVTERIGEYIIDGNENWEIYGNFNVDGYKSFITTITGLSNLYTSSISFISGDFKTGSWNDYVGKKAEEIVWNHDPNKIGIKVKNETASNVEELKTFLASNPITVQYELATPVVKTVDLSSSGNWEKIVLNGSENWSIVSESSDYTAFFVGNNTVPNNVKVNSNNISQKVICNILTPFTQDQICNKPNNNYGISLGWNDSNLCVRHRDFPLTNEGLTQWKQYLSQNPMTVWYQTATHQDSTQVKQPIFFKDGHIQLSSGADNSLIPTLDYQAKTSNSYVMDLMKPSTVYTMKAKSVSGTFTLDGTSYGAGTNGTFTTPSSMTNKLLVMSNKTNEEVMILEGDVTDKTIPYFKGIKSAFEGQSQIEVLSTGKNLFDMGKIVFADFEYEKYQHAYYGKAFHFKPNTTYTIVPYLTSEILDTTVWTVFNVFVNGQKLEVININKTGSNNHNNMIARVFTTDSTGEVGFSIYAHNRQESSWLGNLPFSIIMTESRDEQPYEPYKSNSTKIPLLSPLRSLPNGVCDEIILDRENNKAKIIQRAGEVVLDGKEDWTTNSSLDSTETKFFYLPNSRIPNTWDRILPAWRRITNNRFVSTTERQIAVNQKIEWISGGDNTNGMIQILIKKERLSTPDVSGFKQWLSQNPVMVYYELETPVITEVDLEGFPYIYKDGHIFLNSEIVPTTEIIYSINQCQQISASNEDIIRHEKELTYLQKLIAQYVQVDYESALLSLKV